MSDILNVPSPYQLRAELETAIIQDLLGPVEGETEEIEENRVSDRYLVGLLAPQKRTEKTVEEQPETQDNTDREEGTSTEDGTIDSNVPPVASTMFPSSLGLTFCVDSQVNAISISASWGRYERERSEINFTENGNPKIVWKRYPMGGETILKLRETKDYQWVVNPEEAPEVYVKTTIKRLENQDWIISLFLVNAQKELSKNKDKYWLFQPKLKIMAVDKSAIFRRTPLSNAIDNQEEQIMAMLYRNHVEFAVGHGINVHAEISRDNPQKAISLQTTIIPRYEVPKTSPPKISEIPELEGLLLDMQQLSNSEPQQLEILAQAYQTWIDKQAQKLTTLPEYAEIGAIALAKCQKTKQRIQAGITTLIENPQAREAFQFMNQAMYQQRIHSIYTEKKRRGEDLTLEEIDIPPNRSWYPFQLAFILLNIPSLTDLAHPERSNLEEACADLLWFPTGGGKTEAYLGVAAYTMGMRRLQGIIGDRHPAGITVLMRYTLRLLTLQQFQRSTTLICACENIRRQDESKWGTEPFRIGLWLGGKSTPNQTSGSEDFIKSIRGQQQKPASGSPHQLTNCPWCGTPLDPGKDIQVESSKQGRGRTFIKCGELLGECPFSTGEGLPLVVVDEEIYRLLPTLLIATVDKFAQMPWKGPVQMLFGQISGYCERHGFRSPDLEDKDQHNKTRFLPAAKTIDHLLLRPPDLIIQDELHLISGPLGSLVGLYETVVDNLCSWELNGKTIYPKIIASTATIKQAENQVKKLFSRQLAIFPPQGIDIQDNFFSRQRPTNEETPGRLYLGICAQGRRMKAVTIRVYLAAMASTQYLYKKYGSVIDPWMTLVGYFNSIRELGGTRRLVDDDIRIRLGRMSQRGLADRQLQEIEELTSRKASTDIPEILDRLEIPFNDRKSKHKKPLDVVLATNMLSVGVDVKRLGMMVVSGQPKNTAEYIQATSRVGRTYPGLVITVYNWARPRDLSHYERFEHYHATFYQQVEALSVTPFATGSIYRGLSALLVSLVRLSDQQLNKNEQAGEITADHPLLQRAIEVIATRAGKIENEEKEAQIRGELTRKVALWLRKIQSLKGGAVLKYREEKDGTSIGLLEIPVGESWDDFACPNSLRNVETSINLIFTNQPTDDDNMRLYEPFHQ
ncbi:MAG: helicase [Gloeocapsa sp. DLM2.Bin57]|nr:MAG: helicase [Gloeocapsa sp. DLM2.Bin57]